MAGPRVRIHRPTMRKEIEKPPFWVVAPPPVVVAPAPVVVAPAPVIEAPPVYAQQGPAHGSWYFCPAGYLNAGITSRAKRVRFSFMIFFGVPSGHETITCSSPGYRRSTSFR
jgi:hypothetical protein